MPLLDGLPSSSAERQSEGRFQATASPRTPKQWHPVKIMVLPPRGKDLLQIVFIELEVRSLFTHRTWVKDKPYKPVPLFGASKWPLLPPRFSSKRAGPSVIVLSTALHMS